MNVLVFGKEINELDSIRCYSGVWRYFLPKSLRKLGVSLKFENIPKKNEYQFFDSIDYSGIDHILVLSLRYFTRVDDSIFYLLKTKINGSVCDYHDGVTTSKAVTFCVKEPNKKSSDNIYVGWAADPNLLKPKQKTNTLSILVDHINYSSGYDNSIEIFQSLKKFKESNEWKMSFDELKVRHLIKRQIVDVNFKNYNINIFQGKSNIPYTKLIDEYSKSDIFVVTHQESVGLVTLESAMCGATVVSPEGYIKSNLIQQLNHVIFTKQFNWMNVNINHKKSRDMVLQHNWDTVAKNMIDYWKLYG